MSVIVGFHAGLACHGNVNVMAWHPEQKHFVPVIGFVALPACRSVCWAVVTPFE